MTAADIAACTTSNFAVKKKLQATFALKTTDILNLCLFNLHASLQNNRIAKNLLLYTDRLHTANEPNAIQFVHHCSSRIWQF